MKGFGITRNFWVALVTIIAISLLFTYYLLVYVKNRERLIYEKKFRELERMAENIKVFTDELVKRTEGYLTIEAKNYDNLFAKQQAKLNERDSIYTGYSSIDFRSSIEKLNKEIDSLGNALNQTNSISTNLIDEFDLIEKNWIRINLADSLKKTILKKINIEFFVIRIKDIDMAEDAIEREYETELTEGNTKTTDKTLSKTNKKKNKKAKIIFQNLHNEVRLQTFDSLLKEKNGLNWSGVQDITLGKIDYKLFNNWLTLAPGDDLLLCSLEKSDSIRSEATAVEPWIIINLISILLFLFLGMPLLKLLIMNEVERLQVINVLFTGVAIILGTALIMLFVNFTYHFFGFHYKEMDDDLSILSDSIKNNFLDETSQAYDQLKSLDGKMKWFYTKKSTIYNSALKNTLIEGQYIKNYKPYNQIFWINQKGQLPLVIESNEIDTLIQHLPVVDKRKYFQAAAKNNLWTIPKKGTNDKNLLYVDFIRSMLNGQYQTVVSTRLEHKEKGAIAIGLSTKTFSLQYAALPPGYHACVIDQKGEVKFHTTNERSLQENFLEEIDFEPEILAAIEGRIEQNTSITYDKKNYRAYIQPIDGMPLYLVTFYSFDYYKAPIVLSVWFAVGLILLLFLLLVIQLALLYGLTHLTSKLKIKWFFLTWLRPKKPIKYRYQYVQSIVGCFLVLCLFVTIFIYFPLAKETIVGILVMPLFLLAFHYKLYTSGDSAYKRWARPEKVNSFLGWSCVFVLFIDSIAIYLFDEITLATLWLFVLQVLIALLLAFPFSGTFSKIQGYIFPNTGYKKLYTYSSLLWLILVSIVPVFFFYKYSYEEETKIWSRHLQLEVAKDYVLRQKLIKSDLSLFAEYHPLIEKMGDYQQATNKFKIDKNQAFVRPNQSANRYNRFLFQFVPPLDTLINKSGAQAYMQTNDQAWHWGECYGTLRMHYRSDNEQVNDFSVTSAILPYQYHKGEMSILFWLAIIGGGILSLRTIRFALRNVYGFDIIKPLHDESISADFFSLSQNKRKNFFVIGLPYSGKGKILSEFANYNKESVFRINFQTQIEQKHYYRDQSIVVIEHFEFGLNNHELNKLRLKLLQEFQAKPVQIILCSTVQPHVILDYYDRMESLTTHLKERDEFKKEYMEYKHAKRYWRNVLSGFVVVYLPLNPDGKAYAEENNLIKSELLHGTFLPKLQSHLANQSISNFAECEDFVLKVEDMATTYYHSLWNSFSNTEKRLLYDLAIDRFVNVKNVAAIRTLLQKGVLVISDSLQIFNESFNNFILSVVKEDEEMVMQQEMRSKGSWNSVQLVLILVFLAIAVFIAFAQRNVLQNFNALLTALGGVTALLLRFGGLFTLGSKPKE
jgi:hypothetical protein